MATQYHRCSLISRRDGWKTSDLKVDLILISLPLWLWCPPLHCSLFSDTPHCNGFIWLTLQGSLHNTNYWTLKMVQLRKWLHHQRTQWTTAYLQRRDARSILLKTITYFLISKIQYTYWNPLNIHFPLHVSA